MLYKLGTVREIEAIRDKIPDAVYNEALRILSILDDLYGDKRDIENDDGGIVLIAENSEDLTLIEKKYISLSSNRHEVVNIVGNYIDVLFLCNNEFGINIFLPSEIAPENILKNM